LIIVSGPIVYLNAAGQPIIVLNDHKTAADLFGRRANIYSDRPNNIVVSLLTGGLHIAFMHNGDVYVLCLFILRQIFDIRQKVAKNASRG
jgi:hypothetical protein